VTEKRNNSGPGKTISQASRDRSEARGRAINARWAVRERVTPGLDPDRRPASSGRRWRRRRDSPAPRGTVLLVDDDDDLRKLLAELLRQDGFVVHTAENGRDALEVLAAGLVPDVVLTDLAMPVMDGRALRRALASSPVWQDVPVVVLSSSPRPDEQRRLEVDGVLKKPVELGRLLRAIASACARHQASG
jgi:CheY-like chemotaxis protein